MPTGPSNGRLKSVKLHSFGSERVNYDAGKLILIMCISYINYTSQCGLILHVV